MENINKKIKKCKICKKELKYTFEIKMEICENCEIKMIFSKKE